VALRISDHPVVQHCLAGLRDRDTAPEEFRALARQAITFLLY
jgi:uracil phosphoribosyltransferase